MDRRRLPGGRRHLPARRPGDVPTSTLAADLGALAANGGPTQTLLPLPGNPGISLVPDPTSVQVGGEGHGPVPTTDQRGTASATGFACTSGAVQVPPGKVGFTSAPVSVVASTSATQAVTVAVENSSGTAVAAPADTTVALAATGTGAFFATSSGGAAATSVVVPSGSTGVTVWFGARTAGTSTLTASAHGLASTSQTATVTPAAAATLAVGVPGSATAVPRPR